MTVQQLEMKITQAKATIALLKAENHVTTEAEVELKRMQILMQGVKRLELEPVC